MSHGKRPEPLSREGIGSVFMPGGVHAGRMYGQPEAQEIETPEDHFLRMLADLNRPASRWNSPRIRETMRALLGEEAAHVAKSVTVLSKSYQEHLREHVDSWINTGKGAFGDRPASRRPSRTIDELVTRVFASNHAVPIPVKDGYVVVPVPQGQIMLDGDNGLQAAELMLAGMLVSPWRLKIAKCTKCEKYFSLKHWERTYKDGTICNRCVPRRKVERSADAKKVRRAAAEKELYLEAATHFWRRIVGQSGWREDQGLKDEMVAALTRKIGSDTELHALYPGGRITGKWLAHTKNWQGIEKASANLK
jgi:hypothetical protein